MDNDRPSDQARIQDHWDEVERSRLDPANATLRITKRWLSSPLIHAHVNRRVCGQHVRMPDAGLNRVMRARLGGRVLRQGISVGGGDGEREIRLIKFGIVERMQVFELSQVRIEQGRLLAKRYGVSDKIEFIHGDGLAASGPFDLVHWHSALHHMFDSRAAVRWSRRVLRPGGAFYMSEYIGPNRMQYSDDVLRAASAIRAMLPERYMVGGGKRGRAIIDIPRPDGAKIAVNDPSECVDSENILPAVQEYIPEAQIWMLGGVGYVLALRNLLERFEEENSQDRHWLSAVMKRDEELSRLGLNLRASALALL